MAVKALACELPAATGAPLARWHCPDLARAAVDQGIVAAISDTTIWRWLSADAIKPWRHRSWIFPRDPDFADKAARVLDLYARTYQGNPWSHRLRDLRRREDLHPGPRPQAHDERTRVRPAVMRMSPEDSTHPARKSSLNSRGVVNVRPWAWSVQTMVSA